VTGCRHPAVVAQAEVDGQVAAGQRVLHVGGGVLLLDGVEGITGHADDVVLGAEELRPVVVDAQAAPAGERGHLGAAVAGAELELVRQAAGVEEARSVELVLVLRPLGLVEQEAVVPDEVSSRKGVGRSLGHQLEAAVDLGVHAGQVEVRGEDVGVLDLVRRRHGPKPCWFQVVSWGRVGPALRPIFTLSLSKQNAVAELLAAIWALSLAFLVSRSVKSLTSAIVSKSTLVLP
jgi:hypothetical protein